VKGKLKSMLISFFDIKGIVHKEFILADKWSIPHTTGIFYGNCMNMCKDFVPNFGKKGTSFSMRDFFLPKTLCHSPPHTLLS
jgi:hypothetical protein